MWERIAKIAGKWLGGEGRRRGRGGDEGGALMFICIVLLKPF